MATAYKCDMCGKYVDTSSNRPRGDGGMEIWWYSEIEATLEQGTTLFDICPNCAERIKATMNELRMVRGMDPIPCNIEKAICDPFS